MTSHTLLIAGRAFTARLARRQAAPCFVLFVMLASIGVEAQRAAGPAPGPIRRLPDGKPDLNGFYQADAGGANWGLESHPAVDLTPAGRGVIIDPPDGKLPAQPWAKAERISRDTPERGYDDPTALCFVAGVPRSVRSSSLPHSSHV